VGDLSSGWVTSGTAGVTISIYGISSYFGTHFGYAVAGPTDVWQSLEKTFNNVHSGSWIYGVVGFYDGDYVPFLDEGQLVGQVSLTQGGKVTVIKLWTVEGEYLNHVGVFHGWEDFDIVVPNDGVVTIWVQVKNDLDMNLDLAVLLDQISLCQP
jgi:hypothetical protein